MFNGTVEIQRSKWIFPPLFFSIFESRAHSAMGLVEQVLARPLDGFP